MINLSCMVLRRIVTSPYIFWWWLFSCIELSSCASTILIGWSEIDFHVFEFRNVNLEGVFFSMLVRAKDYVAAEFPWRKIRDTYLNFLCLVIFQLYQSIMITNCPIIRTHNILIWLRYEPIHIFTACLLIFTHSITTYVGPVCCIATCAWALEIRCTDAVVLGVVDAGFAVVLLLEVSEIRE